MVILGGSLVFTNALEHIGERLNLSTGVTGSIFAAVGTALPETAVPIVAFLSGRGHTGNEIGIGAILGAPLMLATLAFFLIGVMALARRGPKALITPEPTGTQRDIRFFLAAFIIAVLVLFIPHHAIWVRAVIALVLVSIYAAYLWRTIRASRGLVDAGHGTESEAPLYLGLIGLPGNNLLMQVLQLLIGVILIIVGARGFVDGITGIAHALNLSPLFLSLAIVPFATELPEKLNSLIWVSKRQDTLAVGNITGAMVFQSSLLPAIGILATPWEATFDVRLAMSVTLVTGVWLLALSRIRRFPALALMINGCAYAGYFVILFRNG